MVPNVDGEKVGNKAYANHIQQDCALASWLLLTPISKVEHITTILNSLPSEYDPFMAVIIAIKESFPLQGVVSVLVDVETRQQTEALKLPIVVHATQASA
ncbi:hypothetical protein Golob_005449 [Gossypium lobatum]|uniref:Uncharacterized protein n=1 Tax=Gossypium lobatum TaxID=34289 RepID=A0A7J8MT77_9ROSI|nr:hypothetical protein [Gossypium lobatum]